MFWFLSFVEKVVTAVRWGHGMRRKKGSGL
jgi:hypothetical protein